MDPRVYFRGFGAIDGQDTVWLALLFLSGVAFGGLIAAVYRYLFNKSKPNKRGSRVAELSTTFNAIREGLLITDDRGRVIAANLKIPEILGIPSQSLFETHHSELHAVEMQIGMQFLDNQDFLSVWNEAHDTPQRTLTREFITAEVNPRTLLVFSTPVECAEHPEGVRIWSFEDVSIHKRLEGELIQSQKMEAIGRLAGGIAHDFNNLLLAMNANLELTLMHPERSVAESVEYLKAAERAAERASTLVKHLLGFSRKTNLELRVRNPNRVIERLQRLLQRILDARIKLQFEYAPKCWNVKLDDTHIEQVLLNLCLNSRDAIEGHDGLVVISSTNVGEDEFRRLQESVSSLAELEPGEYVCIKVRDNGEGMSPDILRKIFDPFFTTKEQGKGTGLGLAMSFGIVRQHNGMIFCESTVDEGATFSIFLPRTQEPSFRSGTSWERAGISTRQQGHILLADDDELVCLSTANALRAQGFDVTAVGNGLDALIHIRSKRKFDLVILDLSMPGMSGREVLESIQSELPTLPIIMTSGYQSELEEFELGHISNPHISSLQKPFHLIDLLRCIQHLIEGKDSFKGRPTPPPAHMKQRRRVDRH